MSNPKRSSSVVVDKYHVVFVVLVAGLGACGQPHNQAPLAAVSASASSVSVGEEVTIDAAASSDPDGDPLLFRWTLDAPESSALELGDLRSQTIAVDPDVVGQYAVHVSVDDGEFESAVRTTTFEATGRSIDGQRPPVAAAGGDQSVEVDADVQLDAGASSDPDADPLSFAWTFEQRPPQSEAQFDDPTAAHPTFRADVAGDYIVKLEVTDITGRSDTDTVVIAAGSSNQPPTADAGADQLDARVGTSVVLDASASGDTESAELSYFWSFSTRPSDSNAALSAATTQRAQFTPDVGGDYTVEVRVTDDGNLSDTDTVEVRAEMTASSTCLLISEYIEGSGYNKAIELYNCGQQPIDLSDYGMCVVSNDELDCGSYDVLLSGTLSADGAVYQICTDRMDASVYDPSQCDLIDSSVEHVTGDDRIVVYEDVDGNGQWSDQDLPTDVFGEIERPPDSEIWKDKTFRRCNFDRFDGRSGFNFREFYTEFDTNNVENFGDPPTEGCPQL